jgi:hypothetical protein
MDETHHPQSDNAPVRVVSQVLPVDMDDPSWQHLPFALAFGEDDAWRPPIPGAVPFTPTATRVADHKRRRCPPSAEADEEGGYRGPLIADIEALAITPPRQLKDMGTFGSFVTAYKHHHEMEAINTREEAKLQDERAGGHDERMEWLLDEYDRRHLNLTIDPPDAFSYALQVQQQAVAVNHAQINYIFADALQVFTDPHSGRLIITVDADTARQLEREGCTAHEFDQVRTPFEAERHCGALRANAEGDMARLAEQAQQQLEVDTNAPEPLEPPTEPIAPPTLPTALASKFREDVMGTGHLATLKPNLVSAIEGMCVWREQTYAPLRDWHPAACKAAWAGATEKERGRWEQAVMEMRQAYCFLKAADANVSVWHEHEEAKEAYENGRVGWTVLRKAAKAWGVQHAVGVKDGYYAMCRACMPASD